LLTADAIPLCVPEIRGHEWAYIKECLDTNFVSSVGPFVERFEREVAERAGTEYGVGTVNGTAALHVALLVAGVEPGDEVLVSDLTFIAPVNAVRYASGIPVLIDAEPRFWQMNPERVVDFLEHGCRWSNGELRNRITGRRVRAVVPVHILGHPVDMNPILDVCRKYALAVIEDATESLGAKYNGRPVGHLGDIACFSFNGNKIITTGGGGMIVCDNEAWARRARYLTTQAKDDPIEYVHHEIGYNYRLTNIQAAMGCAQLELLDEYLVAKRRIADTYRAAIGTLPGLVAMCEADWATSAWWMSTILVNEDEYGMGSRELLRQLKAHNIESRPLWQPAHLSPAQRGAVAGDCHVAEELNRKGLSLPSSVSLTADQQQRVIEVIARAGPLGKKGR